MLDVLDVVRLLFAAMTSPRFGGVSFYLLPPRPTSSALTAPAVAHD